MNQSVGGRHMLEIRRNCTSSWTGGQRFSNDLISRKRARGTLTGRFVTFLRKIWAKWAKGAHSQLAKTSSKLLRPFHVFSVESLLWMRFDCFSKILKQHAKTRRDHQNQQSSPKRFVCKCRGWKRGWSVFYKQCLTYEESVHKGRKWTVKSIHRCWTRCYSGFRKWPGNFRQRQIIPFAWQFLGSICHDSEKLADEMIRDN
jgi:hypothetical protein